MLDPGDEQDAYEARFEFVTDDTPDGIVQDEPARPRDPLAALRLTYDPDHDDRSFIDGWNAALDAAQEAAATRPSGDEALRAALDEAAFWLEAEARYPRADPVPAMRSLASRIRAALATPSSTPDVEGLTHEQCIHGISEREECEHCGLGWQPALRDPRP